GRIGRTHGDRTDTTPAMKARTMPPVAMLKELSEGLVQQCLDAVAVSIPDRPAFLLAALEYNQGRLHLRATPLDKVLLAVEVDHEICKVLEFRVGRQLVQDRRLHLAGRAPRSMDLD